MKVRAKSVVLIPVLIFLAGCSDPNEKANQIYTEAMQDLLTSKTESTCYAEMFDSYKRVKSKIDLILSQYPSSSIAVDLLSDNAKILSLTLRQFREREDSLKALVEAEQFPIPCALLVASTIKAPVLEATALIRITGAYANAGLFTQAIEAANAIEDAFDKACALIRIANKYEEIGQNDQAGQLISQAFRTANIVEADLTEKHAVIQNESYNNTHDRRNWLIERFDIRSNLLVNFSVTQQRPDLSDDWKITARRGDWLDGHWWFTNVVKQSYDEGGHPSGPPKFQYMMEMTEFNETPQTFINERAKYAPKKRVVQLFSQALKTASAIENSSAKAEAIAQIAIGFADVWQFNQANLVAGGILNDADERDSVLYKSAIERADVGQYSEALKIAKTIINTDLRAVPLAIIATEFAESIAETGDQYKSILRDITHTISPLDQFWESDRNNDLAH